MNDTLKVVEVPNPSERELLIQHGTVLNKLCGSITELKTNNAKEHEKIFAKVDKVVTTKISNKLFFWLIGIIITIEIMLASCVGVLNIKAATLSADVKHIENKLDKETR